MAPFLSHVLRLNNACVSQFSNLCGTVYRQGNVLFTSDGNSVLSPVGNRVTVFDLVKLVIRLTGYDRESLLS
jgi:periodic tryptophan protein 2